MGNTCSKFIISFFLLTRVFAFLIFLHIYKMLGFGGPTETDKNPLLKMNTDLLVQVRLLAEKVSDQPESHDDKEKKVEFSVPTWQVGEFSEHTWQVGEFSEHTW
jgi:hypothetical protein